MSKRKIKSAALLDAPMTTEEELQEKWKDHPSPFVQGVLEYRRAKVQNGEKLLTLDEINREVAYRRYGIEG